MEHKAGSQDIQYTVEMSDYLSLIEFQHFSTDELQLSMQLSLSMIWRFITLKLLTGQK